MNIHKLSLKPRTMPPKTYPARKVNLMTWEIFSQEDIKLIPKEGKQMRLGFGFKMSEGVVLAGLSNSLKYKWCSLQNKVISKTLRIS